MTEVIIKWTEIDIIFVDNESSVVYAVLSIDINAFNFLFL